MTEDRLPLAELLQKAGDGDFLRSVAEAVAASDKVVGIGPGLRWPSVTRPGVGSGQASRV